MTFASRHIDPSALAGLVLAEDNHILVVQKPWGLLIQGDQSGRPNLLDWGKAYLKEKYHKPGRVFLGLVHRLDRQVGGVVVLARTSKAAARLSAQFREKTTTKTYLAGVSGRVAPPAGRVDGYLVRDGRRSRPAAPGQPGAQAASLEYRVETVSGKTSLLEIELLTGRRHQIRAQLAGLGHPILGDRLYGSEYDPRDDAIGLYARSLGFVHPTTKDELVFRADPPSDWPWRP